MTAGHNLIACPYGKCKAKLNPANSATNFKNPALSVKIAADRGIIQKGQRILEVGSGNLRNSLYILKTVPGIHMFSYDLQHTINRFAENYQKYKELRGKLVKEDYGMSKYDVVLCTYVLETICPEQNRYLILQSIVEVLKKNGILIASFRGYPGVYGSKYKKCQMKEGLITPLNTFVKPYSISEVQSLLHSCNFKTVRNLQNYKVDRPKNIHVMATI
jgi:SAM-dependent methyltransferase